MCALLFLLVDHSRQKQTVNSSLINLWCAISSWSQCIMASRWQTPLTTLHPSSSCHPLSSAPRRYDITGIGINLWLIHLHFIPREPRHPRRDACTSTQTSRNVHKYCQNLPSSLLLISWGSLFALLPRDGSNPISSSTPPPPPPPSLSPRSFHLLYRDSNSGLIEGFVRWGIASYPGTFRAVLMIFHIYYHISDIHNPFFIKSRRY